MEARSGEISVNKHSSPPTPPPLLVSIITLFGFSSWESSENVCGYVYKKCICNFLLTFWLPGVVRGAILPLYSSTFLNTSIKYLFKTTPKKEDYDFGDFLRLEREHIAGGRCTGTGICSEIIPNKVGEGREVGKSKSGASFSEVRQYL